MTGDELHQMLARNLEMAEAIVSVSGLRAAARCGPGPGLDVRLTRETDGRPIGAADRLTVVTTDFLATGGSDIFPPAVLARAQIHDGPPIREAMAALLEARGGTLAGTDPRLFDPTHPRLAYPAPRPVRCPAHE